jgi:putative thioredoxin
MTEQAYIFELTEQSFGSSAVLNSHKVPVLVEFMGVWSGPCVMVADRLADLAREFAGQFIFAKVDIDEQPGLQERYKIANVPTLLVLRDGEVVRTEVGELQEDELRALLKDFGVFRASDELRLQARARHLAGDTPGAILLLTQAIKHDPGNTRVALDMVQVFLDIGEVEQAKGLFGRLPREDRDSDMGKAITGQLVFLDLALKTDGMDALEQRLAANPDDHDARFDLAICQVAVHRQEQAMDNLFHILQQQPDYKEGAARELIATLTNMLTPNAPELANAYRRQLANLLAG